MSTLIQLVYCRGGDRHAPRVAHLAGMHYGVRHDYTPYAPPYMLDIRWLDYDWPDYLAKVRRYGLALAMAPDYEHPGQRERLLGQIADLKTNGARQVMVCPKFDGAVADIPPECIVAISVPTRYAGFLPYPDEVEGRRLHLLGGTPDQQLYLMRIKYPGLVVSSDQNKFAYKAQRGMVWNARRADWIQMPARRYSTLALQMFSARQIVLYLSSETSAVRYSAPVRLCQRSGELPTQMMLQERAQ